MIKLQLLHETLLMENAMPRSIQERVKKHRDELKAQGLRPLQIWVPDTRKYGFKEECLRQSRLLLNDQHERDTMDWIDDSSDNEGWK
ncbi:MULTISPECIES: antitoxin MazE family protein [Cysteiniphilum]|uniref:antitoxin MazE family protein n=2 Tax=Fastidiosibacteraceae TaxID=2056687 RepID=UPI00193A9B12|nr:MULTISPECIES: antitoxin MazE family protein [Cysteiniphilum]